MNTPKSLTTIIAIVAIVTLSILLIFFLAMQFSEEVVWSVSDFIIAGALLFTTGLIFTLAMRKAKSLGYKAAITLAIGTAFFMVWANLAVGLIGSGPHFGNLMYIGVLAVGIAGAILAHFRPEGMTRAMFATASAVVLVAVIALLANMHHYPGSSVIEILGVNAFFAVLFFISGLLFRYSAKENSAAH